MGARLFDPFSHTKPIGRGHGTRLSVVHGIVTSYGGAITVESVPDSGLPFMLSPCATEAVAANALQLNQRRQAVVAYYGVDDETTVTLVMQQC